MVNNTTGNNEYYESYPLKTMIMSNIVSLAIYGIGAYIIFIIGVIWLGLYIVYIAWMELILLRKSCNDCYYYGRACAFGKGKLACLIVKKGDPENFSKRKITWKLLIPDILVTAVPVIAGIVLMIMDFILRRFTLCPH